MKKVSWTALDCLKAALVVAAIMFIFKGFLEMWGFLFGIDDPEVMLNNEPLFWVSTYLLQMVAFLIGMIWVLPKWSFKKLGFRKIGIMKAVGLVSLVFFLNIGINAFYLYLQTNYGFELPGYSEQLPHTPLFGKSVLGIVSLVFLAVIAAPLMEELFFRGFLLQGFMAAFGKWGAIILSGLAFSVVHFEFGNIVPLFILSLLLGWVFVESNSLWPAVAFHAFNNTLALIIELLVY